MGTGNERIPGASGDQSVVKSVAMMVIGLVFLALAVLVPGPWHPTGGPALIEETLLLSFVAAMLALTGGVVLQLTIREVWHRRLLANDGVTGVGTIIEHRQETSKSGPVWVLRIQFGDGWRFDQIVTKQQYSDLEDGIEIAVRYLPDHPEICHLASRYALDPFQKPGRSV